MPWVEDFFEFELTQHADAWWFRIQIKESAAREEAAELLAVDIATRLLQPTADAFEKWAVRRRGGADHDSATKAELEAYLLSDFAESKDEHETRLVGAVVEHLWASIASTMEGGWGLPLHVEHDHFSVIDHGGDGVSIYDFEVPDLRFRLWEAKRHTSGWTSVTTVVSGAADQLTEKAPEYLARLSKPLQCHADPRIQQLAGKMVKLWTARDDKAGAGVWVGTSTHPLPVRPFKGLKEKLSFTDPAQREGGIVQIPDLVGFAHLVRAAVLSGIS